MRTTTNTGRLHVGNESVQVQLDHGGNDWRNISADDLPPDVREEIAAEIVDGNNEVAYPPYVATNGLRYRWQDISECDRLVIGHACDTAGDAGMQDPAAVCDHCLAEFRIGGMDAAMAELRRAMAYDGICVE